MILAVVPGKQQRRSIVAMVTSVWKSMKRPKLVTTHCPLSHIVAFRCIELVPGAESISTFVGSQDMNFHGSNSENMFIAKCPKNMLSCLENQERIRIIDLEFSMAHDGNDVGLFSKSRAEESRSRLNLFF